MSAAVQSRDRFLELLRNSGLFEAERLEAELQRLAVSFPLPTRPSLLAALLVREGLLTPFQAEQLLHGKWRGFVISGKYKVLEPLGRGGMGQVFLCEHAHLRRLVALKVLPLENIKKPVSVERFYREARATAALDHPNIVRCHDADRDQQVHFLVMEFVDGPSLHQLVAAGGPLEIGRAAHYLRQAALGLQHAHEAGWVHRDIKPANLVVDRQGIVKVLDLGLARILLDHRDQLTKQLDEKTILGTADFLAPEQAMNSHEVDVRADIYSLGATGYFLLSGRAPFEDGTIPEKLLWHQVKEPIPLRQVRPEVHAGLAAVVEKMMAKAPADRYQVPREVADALAPWTETPIAPLSEAEMPRRSAVVRALSSSGAPSTGTQPLTPAAADTPPSGVKETPARPLESGKPESNPPQKAEGGTAPKSGVPATAVWSPPLRRRWVVATAGAALVLGVRTAILGKVMTRETPDEGRPEAVGGGNKDPDPVPISPPVAAKPKTLFVTRKQSPELTALGVVCDSLPLALGKAGAGDRVVVLENLTEQLVLDGAKLPANLTIEAGPSGGKTIWLPAPGTKKVETLLTLINVEGLCLKGFVLDGEDERVQTLLAVRGRCPGLKLEDLFLRKFKQCALLFSGCAGEADRPVLVRRLRTATGKKAARSAAVVLEAGREGGTPAANQHVTFSDCRLEGILDAMVRLDGPVSEVTFQRNRFCGAWPEKGATRLGDAFVCRGPYPLRLTIASNTFNRVSTALHWKALPPEEGAARLVVRDNLFLETDALVRVDQPLEEAFARMVFADFEGNVCRPGGCSKGLAFLSAKPLAFENLSEDSKHDGSFLRYSPDSILNRAGSSGQPVGVPPE